MRKTDPVRAGFSRRGVSILAASCVLGMGLVVVAADPAADRKAIDKSHEAFVAAMRANDCSGMLREVAEDVVFVPPNEPNATGKAAVRAWCDAAFRAAKTTAMAVSERGVTMAGDWAIEHGKFDWTLAPAAGGAPIRELGSFLAIWHRQPDGSWKVARDIWNSSQPAGGR
jgi:ketosteroid isomerase-like protein